MTERRREAANRRPILSQALALSALAGLSGCSDHRDLAPTAAGPTSAAPSAPASPASSPSVAPTSSAGAPAPFRCFSWVHLKASSTDCYRSDAACDDAREGMVRGARHPTPCVDAATAWCTSLSDATADAEPPIERCFGAATHCASYRDFIANGIARDRLRATPCAPP